MPAACAMTNRCAWQAGLPAYRLHDLRHQATSMLVNSGRKLFEVQQVLGHTDPRVSHSYTDMNTETMQDAAN
ncbi:MAG: tyrosine-type recombinase/integrase [Halioglobus sp.]